MAYVTREQVNTKVPSQVLNDALDDDGDGSEDPGLFEKIVSAASTAVDGYLQGLFLVPFPDPAPSKVQQAAFVFVCETIYQRRNVPEEKNPFTAEATWWRNHLQKVGNRELPFDAGTPKIFTPGAAVTDPLGADVQST